MAPRPNTDQKSILASVTDIHYVWHGKIVKINGFDGHGVPAIPHVFIVLVNTIGLW
jgi:hypothetical protein